MDCRRLRREPRGQSGSHGSCPRGMLAWMRVEMVQLGKGG